MALESRGRRPGFPASRAPVHPANGIERPQVGCSGLAAFRLGRINSVTVGVPPAHAKAILTSGMMGRSTKLSNCPGAALQIHYPRFWVVIAGHGASYLTSPRSPWPFLTLVFAA